MNHIIDNTKSINDTLRICAPGDIIILKPGIYHEKVEIYNSDIIIRGESQEETIISNKDFYHKIMPDYNECNTFRTYTCYVEGDNVTIENLTIENTAIPSKIYGQAVALHVHGDNFKCLGCTLNSAQDTLFTGPLPKNLLERHKGFLPDSFLKGSASKQIYQNCKIYGDVDFIFGCATALFINCDIISIDHNNPGRSPDGYICAPSHYQETEYGYLFYKCNLIKQNNNVKDVYLGRPWRDYGCAAFIECEMDDHINPLGFNKWGNTDRDKTARFYEYTNTPCEGREPWVNILTKDEADKYVKCFLEFVNFNKN